MTASRGVLAVWNDLEPGREAQFEAWYEHQHVPERLGIPGFRMARRYRASHGSPRYCAFYWLDGVEVLASRAYLERLAKPTATTRGMMTGFRGMARTPCSIALESGQDLAPAMAWIAVMQDAVANLPLEHLRSRIDASVASGIASRIELWRCEEAIAARANPEQRLRAQNDRVARWILFVEASSEAQVQAAIEPLYAELAGLIARASLLGSPTYALVSSVRAEDVLPPWPDAALGNDSAG